MDEEAEDIEEEDLDCEGEMDPETPPWHDYDEDIDDIEVDETTEDTALLQTAAKTEIIITPISPVSIILTIVLKIIDGVMRKKNRVIGNIGI